jgi:MFS family permease
MGLGPNPAVTISGACLVGSAGSALLATGQSTLSDRHGRFRTVALTESNAATSIGSVLPGLVIGGLVGVGLGWRPAFVVPAVLVAAGVLWRGRHPFGATAAPSPGRAADRLPRKYWTYWAALIPAVGAEWSVVAWAAGYLVDVTGTTEGAASTLMTLFFVAMVAGRLLGSRLSRRLDPLTILVASALIALAGFLVFWRVDGVALTVGGLFVTGLGISTLFPMLLALAIDVDPDQADRATARVPIGAGSAVIVAPLALGWLADRFGIRTAFGVVPALLAAVVTIAWSARRR